MKVVTVHRGARDGYQCARALNEAGLLERLVTDLYWPSDARVAPRLEALVPQRVAGALRSRTNDGVPSALVSTCWASGLMSMGAGRMSFNMDRKATRWCDVTLGRKAARIASRTGSALVSYSYYAHSAFSSFEGDAPRILFQLHPHPASVRAILENERTMHPDTASSLDREWELALPPSDYQRLVDEVTMAQHWIVASQFTKATLVEHGVPSEQIAVIPYGIDLQRFSAAERALRARRPLRLLFVGRLCQRKGIKYLLQALKLLTAGSVELTLCGRPVDNLELFHDSSLPIRLYPGISSEGLLDAYRSADVFVLPSVAEGFAHVLLEAMASGLPIISTARTAAPDLITDGHEGYITSPGSATELAARIEEFLRRPQLILEMGQAARRRAEFFTWKRFRQRVASLVGGILCARNEGTVLQPCL